jgi:Cu(I)/Ag(I) efflux system membrane fusion protein/cobalt-zinc-cadmium efflux system membrane fusion protein
VTTENEYLLANQNRDLLAQSSVPGVESGAATLLSSAAERLKQWMIPDREIEELEQSGRVKR